MIKLKTLLEMSDTNERYQQWVMSMVSTVRDTLIENGLSSTDEYHAYDIIKTDFKAGTNNALFQQGYRDAITILKKQGIVK